MISMFGEILNNFHVFVLASTLLYYILLRMYKKNVISQIKENGETSNLIYVLFVPVLLYTTRFLFLKSQIISNNYYGGNSNVPNNYASNYSSPKVDRYLKTPYPDAHSTISSASITI